MPSKFYLNGDTLFYTPPAWQGAWTNSLPKFPCILDTESYGNSTAYPYFQNGTSTPPPHKSFLIGAVSRVLSPQTISGTVDLSMMASERNLLNNAFTRLHIWVVNATTNTVFATLLNQFEDTIEWTLYPGSVISLSAPQTLTPCTIPSDGNTYRLVVELGTVAIPTAGNYYEVQTVGGSRSRVNMGLLPDATAGVVSFEQATIITFSHTFLMVALPIQPNKVIENAIDLGSLPVNLTYDSIGPLVHWFKITITEDMDISIIACNTTPRTISLNVYRGDLTSNLYVDGMNFKGPLMVGAKAGDTLFLKMRTPESPTGDLVTFDIIKAPSGTIQVGDLLVLSDDTSNNYYDPTIPGGYHGTWYNVADGSVRLLTSKMIASELGVSLANGRYGIADQENNKLIVYEKAPSLTIVNRITLPSDPTFPAENIYPEALGTDFVSFYVGTYNSLDNKVVFKISEMGVIGSQMWNLPSPGRFGDIAGGGNPSIGVTRDGKILYWGDGTYGGACRRHDLITDTEILPAFTPPTEGPYSGGEVIVMKDNSVVCLFVYGPSVPNHKLVHYSPTGVILREIPYTSPPFVLHHICHNSVYDMKIWVFHNTTDYVGNRFQLIDLTDGTILKDFTSNFSDNLPIPGTCTPVGRFDSANSCPLMIMMEPFDPTVEPPIPVPTDISGIYLINPIKALKHDSFYPDVERKIPNPTVRSALIGE